MPSKTTLVIDDDPIFRADLATILEGKGFSVLVAADGIEGWKYLLADHCPDMIMLDMVMPGLDGWQFCRLLKANKSFDHVQLIIMTGMPIASEEWAASFGAIAFLRKPIEVEALLKVVAQCG